MPDLSYPHIFISDGVASENYTSPLSGRDDINFPDRPDRKGHAAFVRQALDGAWEKSEKKKAGRHSVSLPTRAGNYVEFESAPGFDLKTKSLDIRASGIRLLNVSTKKVAGDEDKEITYATVFIPTGKEKILLSRIEQYENDNTESGNPKHEPFIAGIANLKEAVLESFWRDMPPMIPETADWCEVWLRYSDNPEETVTKFKSTCNELNIPIKEGHLTFPERAVVIVRAVRSTLDELLLSSDDIAELRRAKATADFWMKLDNSDQSDWAVALADRVSVDADSNASLCLLDTGVNNGHILLEPIIADADCHTVNPTWGTSDEYGHGTLMCGVAAYGDGIDVLLQSSDSIEMSFVIETVKLIPTPGHHHDKELYGLITKQALSRAEIEKPDRNRTTCLAISSEDGRDEGRPSSWSASIDQLCSGAEDSRQRLIVVAAGNIAESTEWKNYPESNITQAVHDPGQAWNALTVGAYTDKAGLSDVNLAKTYSPIASAGQLSPFSTTSHIWDSKWPNKPDVVFEGGNAGIDSAAGIASELDDLSILSTHHLPQVSQFMTMNATSAASAQAARMATRLRAQYPDAWPETIRALMVHSASWTEELRAQFFDAGRTDKQNSAWLLRTCGFGVPNYETAVESAKNSLTLITEQTIQPFQKKVSGSDFETKDMHLIELPWPANALDEMPGETPVTINVTLSYFVEPGPGEIGWRDKYRYRSHGLDFDLIGPTEDKTEFLMGLNKAARDDENVDTTRSSVPWTLGRNARSKGSIHRDWWQTTAAEAAQCNVLGVFPRTGWWKERSHLERGSSETRYSLIVTLHTPSSAVDIYTPIANLIAPAIDIF